MAMAPEPCKMRAAQTAPINSVGAKANSLQWLKQHGFPVPNWDTVTTSIMEEFLSFHAYTWPDSFDEESQRALRNFFLEAAWPETLKETLQQMIAPLLREGPLAVRSSATLEDLAEASFAGQYESYLELKNVDEVLQGVRKCWASLAAPRVSAYLETHRLSCSDLRMAVILQVMVPAKCAGVAFSMNPVTGADNEILIEACRGLGEALVSGLVTPDRYCFDKEANQIMRREFSQDDAVLSDAEITCLARYCVEVQAEQGHPVDLEWASDGEKIWLVQSRPITAFGTSAYEGEWTTADMKDGGVSSGVCTPFMASLYEQVFVGATPKFYDGVGLTAAEEEITPWYMVAYGRPYWNVGHIKSRLALLPGYNERSFDEDLGIEPAYEGDGITTALSLRSLWKGLKVLSLMQKSFAHRLDVNRVLAVSLPRRLEELESFILSDLDETELKSTLSTLLSEDYDSCECAYFVTIYDNSNAQTIFQEKLSSLVGKQNAKAMGLPLLCGLEDLSHLRPTKEEFALVSILSANAACVSFFKNHPTTKLVGLYQRGEDFPGREDIHAYLERWKWMAPRTLEILQQRWGEDPTPVFESLRRGLGHPSTQQTNRLEQAEIDQRAAYQTALQNMLPFYKKALPGLRGIRRRGFLSALKTTRDLLWWREEMRTLSTRMYAQVRRFTLAYGRHLCEKNILNLEQDIFFLRLEEIMNLLQGKERLPSYSELVDQRRLAYRGFRNFDNPDEIGSRWGSTSRETSAATPLNFSENGIRGIAGSAGCYTGTARVIETVEQVERLKEGDILVTRFTDPGWTMAFAHIGAVVTETGGVLSHAAVIAREYGFPAVLAAKSATKRIPDGATITVDGNQGSIEIIQE